MNKCIKYITLASFCCLAYSSARAQYSDDQFNPDASDNVSALAVQQPDGKIIAGGSFATIGGLARVRIARLLANGHGDTTFDPGAAGANATVHALAIQADGKILVGGAFTYLATDNRSYIGRLNSDGTLDASFNPGASGTVKTMAVQTDGKILVGGEFATSLGGQVRTFIGRLNSDGTLDTSFNPTVDGFVNAIALQTDGKILMGGDFTVIGGAGRTRIARLNADGSLDTTFVATNANNTVSAMAIQADGKILVGGIFTTIGGQDRNFIARLNTDGSVDTNFNPNADTPVNALAIQPDGKILVGGSFATLGVTARPRIGRLNLDGTVDTTFAPTDGADATVSALAVQTDGSVLAGGSFHKIGNVDRNHIGRLYPDGRTDQNFIPETSSTIYGISVQTNSNILIGGPFTSVQAGTPIPLPRQHIARVYNDGYPDTAFDPGAGSDVYSLAVQSNGLIIAAGIFDTLAGVAHPYLGRLNTDGTLDATLNLAPLGSVVSLAMQSDGKFVAGGGFTTLGGQPRTYVGRFNADGSLDVSFNPTVVGVLVLTLAVQSDGKILVGGLLTKLGDQDRSNIGRLNSDGSVDTTFNPSANSTVYAIAIQPDGKILIGGAFTTVGTVPVARKCIARLNADGSLDTTFDPNLGGMVNSIVLQADGKIIIGGQFTTVGAVPVTRNRIARLNADGSLDTSFDLTDGADSSISSLAIQPDGKIIVGGYFDNIGAKARKRLARIANTEAALQSLSVSNTGSAVTWTRTGASPEVWLTTFDQSTNGSTWTSLGAGTRITNGSPSAAHGWQLTGLSLPQEQTIYIRARGYGIGGMWNNSISIYESIRLSYLTPTPPTVPVVIITNVSGVVTGYYGAVNYTLSGTNNAYVTGTMWWTNSLGGNSSFAATNPWSVTVTNLSIGANSITVYGSNLVGNIASNSATIVQRRNDYLAADFDGDHLSDPAFCNGTNWYEWLSSLSYARTNAFSHSIADAFPVSVDFDGDSVAEPAIYDNKTGNWYIWVSPLHWQIGPLSYGVIGAAPVPADYDGDRMADFAVYAAGSWYAWFSTAGYAGFGPFNFGTADAIPVAGDFDGDRKADPAIYLRGYWYAWLSSINYVGVSATVTGDPNAFPVTSDFDGDGLCDLATVNGGIWYARLSTAGYQELGPFTFNAEGWSWVLPDSP